MKSEGSFMAIVVAALVALAGFTGAVGAAEPTGAQTTESLQEEELTLQLDDVLVQNLSTSMTVENATIEVQNDSQTETVTVDSASIELTNATVDVTNATLEDGRVHLDEATVSVTEGTLEIESSEGNRTIDLSDTNTTVENRTVVLQDLTDESIALTGDLGNATIREMTVQNVSGTTDVDSMAVNVRAAADTDQENVSMAVVNGTVSVEDGTVTLVNATMEDGTLHAERVNGSVGSASVDAERVVLLRGLTLDEYNDVQMSVQDESFNRTDVEVEVSNVPGLFESLLASQAAASAT